MVQILRRLRMILAPPDDPTALPQLIRDGIVEIGEHTYGQPRVVAWISPIHGHMGSRVKIGRYCAIGGNVTIMPGGEHRTDWVSSYPLRLQLDLPGKDMDGAFRSKGDITIGNDVWIGEGAAIMSGVTIGHGAVIGAYTVVAKDVAPYSIVVGNPARELRRRFTEDQIDGLLDIAWWDWPTEKVKANVDLLNGPSIDAFLSEHQIATRAGNVLRRGFG